MFDLSPNDAVVKTYIADLARLKSQKVTHELGLRSPFQTLLDRVAKKRNWTLVPELSTVGAGGRRIVPDGTIRDEFRIARGWWEAKDTSDNLVAEIGKKVKAGYPLGNTIFEDTNIALLYQNRASAGEFVLSKPVHVANLLNRFLSHDEANEQEFRRAMEEFKSRIPDLAQSLSEHIAHAHATNGRFKKAFAEFVSLCHASLNPGLSERAVDEMLIQHLLTERLIRRLFQNEEFVQRNIIAREVEQVIKALASPSFSRAQFLARLDPFYTAIEREGANLHHFTEKQDFLNSVYEQFFQRFCPDTADTHGIVYTPREIVDYMCQAVEGALKEEFGYSLASPEVVILDPCTGTGNFIVNLIQRMPGSALSEAYRSRLFANEVMLLPYYLASLNIEHAYFERMQQYESFEGLSFVDTLDTDKRQLELFTPANTKRVRRGRTAPITVVIGNPPYNVGQKSENDNNKNRRYPDVDQRIRESYSKDSKATNKNSLSDMYVKFFRWATDRLGDRDGIVCLVSNNSFIDQLAFDGMRKHLAKDFQRIDHIDLHGNVRRNPKLSGTTHNVFGIRVGVGITVATKKKGATPKIRYHRVPETWRKTEKLNLLAVGAIPWEVIQPSVEHSWVQAENSDEFRRLIALGDIFAIRSRGLETTRDDVVYDFRRPQLENRVKAFIQAYNSEVDRHKREPAAPYSPEIKWSSRLKECLARRQFAEFQESKIRVALYRPFTKRYVFFDSVLNQRTGQWPIIDSSRVIWIKVGPDWPFFCLTADVICDLLPQGGSQCFPIAHIVDSAVRTFQHHYNDPAISKENVFDYVYALLHHPRYRERYSASLKLELPRIPFAPDFSGFAEAGRKLADLHVNYETVESWPLTRAETKGAPYSERVEKMKLSKDGKSLTVNASLMLGGIPPEAFEYRLGNRSALEWVIDQYQLKGDSDPNREDDPGYIVRLVGQVIRVSMETMAIVKSLPPWEQRMSAGRESGAGIHASRKRSLQA